LGGHHGAELVKKFIVALAICFLALRPSYSVAPLIVVAGAAAETAGGTAVIDAAGTGFLALVGAIFLFFRAWDNAGNEVRVPLTTQPNPIPAPSAPASANQIPGLCTAAYSPNEYSTLLDACTSGFWAAQGPGMLVNYPTAVFTGANATLPSSCSPGVSVGSCTYKLSPGGATQYYGMYSGASSRAAATCPSGYTVSGSSCVLANARAVTPDNKCDLSRSGTTLTFWSSELDCSGNGRIKGYIGGSPSSFSVAGQDAQGKPVLITITARADGGSDVSYKQQTQDANANSYIQEVKLQVAPDGAVLQAQRSGAYGSLSVDPANQTATQTASPNTVSSPQQSPQTIQFPSDYARQGEAMAAANSLAPKLDQLHQDLTQSSSPPSDPDLPAASDFENSFFKNTFTGLLSWQLPGHSSACPTPSFSALGSVYTIDSHCQLINDHWGILSAAMVVVWTLGALFIVLKA
jgi:hypothetical protein